MKRRYARGSFRDHQVPAEVGAPRFRSRLTPKGV